jgi:hypothetical protein
MRRVLVLVFLSGACQTSPPKTPPHLDPIAANETCATCHAEIAREWKTSLHHASFDDPIFLASYAREPARFCVDCHAPEDKTGEGRASLLASLGTACTTCHKAPHEKKTNDAVVACAGCHEFSFPGREASARLEDKMQRTLAEHSKSDLADVACTSCHMPTTNGHKSHIFGGGHDPKWLASAIDVKAKRSDRKVTIAIAPGHVGHAIPTGDLFRRLLVGVETVDERGEVIARDMKPMGREFAIDHGQRIETADTRPGTHGANASTVELTLSGDKGRWFVSYQRVLGESPGEIEVAQDLRVMEGWIE